MKDKKQIHGSIIGSRLLYAEHRWGAAARRQLVGILPPKEKKLAESRIYENCWVDFYLLDRIDKAIIAISKQDHLQESDVLRDVGRFSADYNYSRLPAKLISLTPDELLRNAVRIKALFQDFGHCHTEEVLETDERLKGLAVVYCYSNDLPESYSETGIGFLERLVELLGYKVASIKKQAVIFNDSITYHYEIFWEIEPLVDRPEPTEFLAKEKLSVCLSRKEEKVVEQLVAISSSQTRQSSSLKKAKVWSYNKAFSRKEKRLFILTLIAVILATVQIFLVSSTAEQYPESREEIEKYVCSGDLKLEVWLDRPAILVQSQEELKRLRIGVEQQGQNHSYMIEQMPENRLIELYF
ncbi:MAG: hypothetical protein JNN15_06185, partial [Blastocatellia bacterium]|nr:hypothetical protein [Blastocatellia bacterium]